MEMEWNEAQNIVISVDLVAAAKQQLDFLAAVDRNRWLYEGPALLEAINRYNSCWLPLLAKHSETPFFKGPLVVPLDCEWIWHCHRLNPVRYKSDCKSLYGTVLDNHNVVSSIIGTPKGETEKVWKQLYPTEPYELDLPRALSSEPSKRSEHIKYSSYDLVSAVKRQSPFFYQVSRPHMYSEMYLVAAIARYKGFLHLIRRNKEKSIRCFCVPTYDIDLIWHTHQLHPVSYCKDLLKLLGKVLEHDDTDSDRTKGNKLETGFSSTTKHWEETYGCRYWRAGAMYRGNEPLPLPIYHNDNRNTVTKKVVLAHKHDKLLHLPERKVLEVMLEFVGLRNVPEEHKGRLFVSFSKEQPDPIFSAKRRLNIFSESAEKQVACFQCQASGNFLFELKSQSSSNLPLSKPQVKTMGFASLSLEELLSPTSNLSVEKWLELVPNSKMPMPIFLRVAISVTIPTKAPYVLHMIRSRPFSKSSCLFPLPGTGQNWTRLIDEDGVEIMNLQMRDFSKPKGMSDSMLMHEVIAVTKSGETQTLAKLQGREWSLIDSEWSICFHKNRDDDGRILKLTDGLRIITYFAGRKLDYQPRHHENQRSENEFMTAVEFSAENPYGKTVAMVDLKFGIINVKEEWFLFPGTITAFILCDILRKEGYDSFSAGGKNLKNNCSNNGVAYDEDSGLNTQVAKDKVAFPSGGGCGGAYGSMIKSSGCAAGGCGSACGSMMKSSGCAAGGCGGGCGGCGSNLQSGGCGGCGSGGCGGCGSNLQSGGCGGCGSGGCGGCGGGCGSMTTIIRTQ
ncbi:unnamed protein product [Cuscuta epithymum]|uniref:Glycine-rich domain-containing protein 1 n=1 Tax=Cuscuta epithymum TaxID=186058 RepID=A0AAV0D020_9ASTE|nr:unnamed protein product [Cuscuta epithymum]